MFPPGSANQAICFSDVGSRTDYCVLAVSGLADLHFGAAVDAYQQVPRYRYVNGDKIDNITDWGLHEFRSQYQVGKAQHTISKDAIFSYVYAVLHDPAYRSTYAQNLKREFPRIPFYRDFWWWADRGKDLLSLHIGYETVEPWPLERLDDRKRKGHKADFGTALFKANRDAGVIQLDEKTTLTGIPQETWRYRLGNRSALEWILDQYKEKKPKDPVIAKKFDTYRFASDKNKVIDLLKRVTRVSVETMRITGQMQNAKR